MEQTAEVMNWNEYLNTGMIPANELIDDVLANMEALRNTEGTAIFSTSLVGLDEFMSLAPKQLYILAGRSGVGKTALASQMMSSVLRQLEDSGSEGIVAYFSAEMSAEQLMVREACRELNLNSRKILMQTDRSPEYFAFREYMEGARERWKRWLLDQSPSPTHDHMMKQLKDWTDLGKTVKFVIFDFAQLSGESGANEAQRMSEVMKSLKKIAKRFNCPVLVLHQFSRSVERRNGKEPSMADLMYGGEQAADVILGIVPRDEGEFSYSNQFELHILKNRFGETGVFVPLLLNKPSMLFQSAEIQTVDLNETYGEVFGD